MSGFEIAGIVLALYPTLLDAAKGLRGFQKVQRWWQFEAEFEDFIAAVETQSIAFFQTIEILVGQLDVSEEERAELENDANSRLWHQPHIQAELRRRVKNRYFSWFTRQLKDINEAMNELYQLLPIGKVYHLDSTSLESEIFRFKQSFSSRKEQLLFIIKDRTEELYQFLDRATQISRSTPPTLLPKSKSQAGSFLSVQRQARELFECFQKNWACTCAGGHPCGITVRKEAGGTGKIGLLVTTNAERAQLSVEFREVQPPRRASETSSISKQEDITNLKTQIEVKSRMKKMKDKASKGVFSLAFSSMSTVANPHCLDEGKSPFEKKSTKLKKRLRFSLPSTPREPISATSSTLSAVSSNSTAVESTPATSTSEPAPTSVRQVRFAGGSPEPSTPEPDANAAAAVAAATPITNICEQLGSQPEESSYLGFWAMDQTKVLLHRECSTPVPAGRQFETVEEFLATTPRRDKRMRVGLSTLLTVLSLGPSPWLPPKLDRTHLLVHNDAPPPATASPPIAGALPYLQHTSLLATLTSPPTHSSAADFAKTTLLSLGILLLELVFRETVECQPAWTMFLSNGQPNEATALCTALQWQKRVEEEFGFGLADAVRRCVLCMFDAPLDLGSAAFVQAVWVGVVRPLEDFLQGWDR